MVADVVVARAPLREQRLGFRAIALALAFVDLQPRAQAKGHRTPEAHVRGAVERERPLDLRARLVRAAQRAQHVGSRGVQRGLIALRADRLGERESALDERQGVGVPIAECEERALAIPA